MGMVSRFMCLNRLDDRNAEDAPPGNRAVADALPVREQAVAPRQHRRLVRRRDDDEILDGRDQHDDDDDEHHARCEGLSDRVKHLVLPPVICPWGAAEPRVSGQSSSSLGPTGVTRGDRRPSSSTTTTTAMSGGRAPAAALGGKVGGVAHGIAAPAVAPADSSRCPGCRRRFPATPRRSVRPTTPLPSGLPAFGALEVAEDGTDQSARSQPRAAGDRRAVSTG